MKSEVIAQLQWRYACKKFDNTRQLSKDQLAVVKQAFDLTATSYGLQPLKMVVVQDQSLKEYHCQPARLQIMHFLFSLS